MLSIAPGSFVPKRFAWLALIAVLAGLAVAPSAVAAPPVAAGSAVGSGTVTVLVGGNGKAAKALANRSVKVRAIEPATKLGARLTFPVARIAVADSAVIVLRGGLRFKAGKRSLALRAPRLRLAGRQAVVTLRHGYRRLPLLVARLKKGQARLNSVGGAAALDSAKLRLTTGGARLLRKKLRLDGLRAGALGALGVDARAGSGGGGAGGGGGGGATCNPNPDAPPVDPATEPAPLARPAAAVDVASATIVWRPRESWIRYINGGEGTCVFDGAVAGQQEVRAGSSAPLVYSFQFPFEGGWYDAATGTAAVRFRGGVGFKWKGHGINFSAGNPEIEVNGSDSRGIFRFNGADGTARPNRRDVLVDLTPGTDQGVAPDHSFPDMPGTLPPGAEGSIFAGFYPPEAPFGTVSISFTAPLP
jgi:Htaa protein